MEVKCNIWQFTLKELPIRLGADNWRTRIHIGPEVAQSNQGLYSMVLKNNSFLGGTCANKELVFSYFTKVNHRRGSECVFADFAAALN